MPWYDILVCVTTMMLFIDYILMIMRMTCSHGSGFKLFVWSNHMIGPWWCTVRKHGFFSLYYFNVVVIYIGINFVYSWYWWCFICYIWYWLMIVHLWWMKVVSGACRVGYVCLVDFFPRDSLRGLKGWIILRFHGFP